MKISIIAHNINYCVKELIKESKKKNLEVETVKISSLSDAINHENWGDVIIWRNSLIKSRPVSISEEEILILDYLSKKGKKIFNIGKKDLPLTTNKYYQQQKFLIENDLNTDFLIDTFTFRTKDEIKEKIAEGILRYPFVEKPTKGSQGIGVRLIKKFSDIKKTNNKIYQNFIKNNGDFRAICLGGKILGIIKRIGNKDDFRNNISQGGCGEVVFDQGVIGKISEIALSASEKFNLTLCGVDIIFDKNTESYKFLEINTLVWWAGFQKTTGINVAKEIIKLCTDLNKDNNDPIKKISEYYFDNMNYMSKSKQFHFNSRMFFWTKKSKSRTNLKKLKSYYINKHKHATEPCLTNNSTSNILNEDKDIRDQLIDLEYPKLKYFNKLLFQYLFIKNIYNENISSKIKEKMNIEELLEYRNRLYKNKEHLLTLSTVGINYLYNLDIFLNDIKLPKKYCPDVKKIYKFSKSYKDNPIFDTLHHVKIYYYTHSIINGSEFYTKRISKHKKIYIQMAKDTEKIILENFFDVKLDNKLEFLVCCKILNIKSPLEEIILSETKNSFSELGNYIVDKYNTKNNKPHGKVLDSSEHRNVLSIMAFTKPTF